MLDDMTPEFPSEQGSSPTPVLESAQNAAEQLKTVVKEQATETGGKIKEEAEAAVSHLQAAGNRFAITQKDALASKAGEWAEALGAASQKLNDTDAPNLLAGPAESFAGELSRLANYLKDSDPAQIAEGLGQLARRKPELVFGGLFLTGLVAARFLKASGHRARVRDHSNLASTGSPYPFAHSQPAPSYE